MLAALASMTLAAAVPAATEPVAQASDARPAIYAIADGDTTIYLFGTFHVLDSKVRWFDGAVERAFDKSDELVVETVPPQQPVKSAPPLPAGMAKVTPTASFLATTQDAVRAGNAQGMNLSDGADMVLLKAAAEQGKPVEPLETLQSQFTMFSKIPAETPPAPAAATQPADKARAEALNQAMSLLESAWAKGEHGVFTAMLKGMKSSSPNAYRIMFAERNSRWADWVAARMRTPGTVFVAVGAGHLAGPDSLLVRLAQRGMISRRVR